MEPTEFVQYFSYFVAHATLNRLTMASTYAQLMAGGGMDPEKMQNLAEETFRSVGSTIEMHRALEAFTAIRPGTRQSTRVTTWLDDWASEVGIRIEREGPDETLMLDTDLWGVAAQELFRNVCEHGNGVAEVKWMEVAGGRRRLLVQDRGPGLGTLDPERAFDPGRSVPEKENQCGFGLTKVLWAATLLGGRAWLSRRPEGGVAAMVEGRLST